MPNPLTLPQTLRTEIQAKLRALSQLTVSTDNLQPLTDLLNALRSVANKPFVIEYYPELQKELENLTSVIAQKPTRARDILFAIAINSDSDQRGRYLMNQILVNSCLSSLCHEVMREGSPYLTPYSNLVEACKVDDGELGVAQLTAVISDCKQSLKSGKYFVPTATHKIVEALSHLINKPQMCEILLTFIEKTTVKKDFWGKMPLSCALALVTQAALDNAEVFKLLSNEKYSAFVSPCRYADDITVTVFKFIMSDQSGLTPASQGHRKEMLEAFLNNRDGACKRDEELKRALPNKSWDIDQDYHKQSLYTTHRISPFFHHRLQETQEARLYLLQRALSGVSDGFSLDDIYVTLANANNINSSEYPWQDTDRLEQFKALCKAASEQNLDGFIKCCELTTSSVISGMCIYDDKSLPFVLLKSMHEKYKDDAPALGRLIGVFDRIELRGWLKNADVKKLLSNIQNNLPEMREFNQAAHYVFKLIEPGLLSRILAGQLRNEQSLMCAAYADRFTQSPEMIEVEPDGLKLLLKYTIAEFISRMQMHYPYVYSTYGLVHPLADKLDKPQDEIPYDLLPYPMSQDQVKMVMTFIHNLQILNCKILELAMPETSALIDAKGMKQQHVYLADEFVAQFGMTEDDPLEVEQTSQVASLDADSSTTMASPSKAVSFGTSTATVFSASSSQPPEDASLLTKRTRHDGVTDSEHESVAQSTSVAFCDPECEEPQAKRAKFEL